MGPSGIVGLDSVRGLADTVVVSNTGFAMLLLLLLTATAIRREEFALVEKRKWALPSIESLHLLNVLAHSL